MAEWIPQCFGTPDDPKVAAFCSSEPDAGSDVSAIRTTAKYDQAKRRMGAQRPEGVGDQRRDCQRARRHRLRGPRRSATWPRCVRRPESGVPGCEQGAKAKKHGLRASHTADVYFDDCRVPAANLLGGKEKLDERIARAREGGGAVPRAVDGDLRDQRPTVGSQALGIARAAYEYALEYAKGREQFGRAIIENQDVASRWPT